MSYHALGNCICWDPSARLHQDPMQAFQFFIEIQRIKSKTIADLIVNGEHCMHTESYN